MFLDRTLKRPVEVEAKLGLPLLLSIPETNLNGKHSRLSTALHNSRLLRWKSGAGSNGAAVKPPAGTPESLPLEATKRLHPFFEALRDRLIMFFELKNLTYKPKLVAVTSCGSGAGVTTVASGLAAALSETGDGNVLLVDMNVEGGAAHYFHKGELACGLEDALESDKREGAMVQEKLYVVSDSPNDKLPRILHKRFSSLMPKLKASDYDYIIFDMPPMSQISTSSRVARFMDLVLLVVESEKTDRDVAKRATEMLTDSAANVAVVLNKTRNYVPRQLNQNS
jgi:Mrp family chromosome partitioning ATPase